jgi:hypothetical protein
LWHRRLSFPTRAQCRISLIECHFKAVCGQVDLVRGPLPMEADSAFATRAENDSVAAPLCSLDPVLARKRKETHVDNASGIAEAGLKRRKLTGARPPQSS